MTTQSVTSTTLKVIQPIPNQTKQQSSTLKLFQEKIPKNPEIHSKMTQIIEKGKPDISTLVGQNTLPKNTSNEKEILNLFTTLSELQRSKKENEFVALFVAESGALFARTVSRQNIHSPFFTAQAHAYSKLNQLLENSSNTDLSNQLKKTLTHESPILLEITCAHIDICCKELEINKENQDAKTTLKTLFINLKKQVQLHGNSTNGDWISHAQKQREFIHALFTDTDTGIRSLSLPDVTSHNPERFLSHVALNGVVDPHSMEFTSILRTQKETRRDILQQTLPQMREYVRVNPQIIYDKDFPKEFCNDFELILIATGKMPKACLKMGDSLTSDTTLGKRIVMEALCSLSLNNLHEDEEKILKLADKLLPQTQNNPTTSLEEQLRKLTNVNFSNPEDPIFLTMSSYLQTYPIPSFQEFMETLDKIKNNPNPSLEEIVSLSSIPSGISMLSNAECKDESAILAALANPKNRELIRIIMETHPQVILWVDSSIQNDPVFKKEFYREWKNIALENPQALSLPSCPKELKDDIELLKLCLSKDPTIFPLISPKIMEKHSIEMLQSLVVGADSALLDELNSDELELGPTFKLTINQKDLHDLKKTQLAQCQIKNEKITQQLLIRKITYTNCESLSSLIHTTYEEADETLRPNTIKGIMKELCTEFSISPKGFFHLLPEEVFGKKEFTQLLLSLSTNGLLYPDCLLNEKKVTTLISNNFFTEVSMSVKKYPEEVLAISTANIIETALTRYLLNQWSHKTPLVPLAISLGRQLMKAFELQPTSDNFQHLVKALGSAITFSAFTNKIDNKLLFDPKMDEFIDLNDPESLEPYLSQQLQQTL